MAYKNKEARAAQSRRWRAANPEKDKVLRQRATAKQKIKRNAGDVHYATQISREHKAILVEYKGGCCKDCGGVFPLCCYDFDHLQDKTFEFGGHLGMRIELLKVEADKCDLVCANCHRIRTRARQGVPHAR